MIAATTIRWSILTVYIILYLYVTITNPYKKTVKLWIFDIIFFSIPIIWSFTIPMTTDDIEGENTADANLNNVLAQTLAVIAAVGVLATFFVSNKKNHFNIITEYLMISFIFAVIGVLPIKLGKDANTRILYQTNLTVTAAACSFSFIGKAFIALIQEENI